MALDDLRRPSSTTGPRELPPYYAERLDTIPRAVTFSGRRQAVAVDPEAQAERLFRDFKLGLLTLVVVALLLLAYFWDGERRRPGDPAGAEEGVLSIRLSGRRRSEVMQLPAPAPETRRAPSRRPRRPTGGDGGERGHGRSGITRPPGTGTGPGTHVGAGRAAFAYTVKPGDTLSAIALRFYGDAAGWRLIFRANRRRLRRPSDLRAGMRILIPAKPREARRPASPSSGPAGARRASGARPETRHFPSRGRRISFCFLDSSIV